MLTTLGIDTLSKEAEEQIEILKQSVNIVGLSGGKDSMLLAKLMQQLQRHSEVPFELVFLMMDPGYYACRN